MAGNKQSVGRIFIKLLSLSVYQNTNSFNVNLRGLEDRFWTANVFLVAVH